RPSSPPFSCAAASAGQGRSAGLGALLPPPPPRRPRIAPARGRSARACACPWSPAPGEKLAALDASPSWRLRDVLAGAPAQGGAPGSRRRVFFGETELRGGATLAEIGAFGGSELTLVVTPALHVLTASGDRTAKIWHAESGQCLRTLEGHGNDVVSACSRRTGWRC
ncbi:unnamed protein product, partial [Prorocentrum cordatum]